MQKPDFEAEAHFSQPFRQIAMMLVVLGLCGAGGFIALPRVLPVFQANPWLNGFGDLPDNLDKFALSLPHWDGDRPPKPLLAGADRHSKNDCRRQTRHAAGNSCAR